MAVGLIANICPQNAPVYDLTAIDSELNRAETRSACPLPACRQRDIRQPY